jgi:protein-S-isoprenylcysteine O-methyltransferase Ste14
MTFSYLPALLATCFARLACVLDARSALRLPRLLCRLLFGRGRRTCTSWFRAAGITDEFRPAYTTLWACGRQARSLAAHLLPTLDPVLAGPRLLLAIDDTPTARWCRCPYPDTGHETICADQRPCYTDRQRSGKQRVRRQKWLLLSMAEALRLSSLALFAIGPVVAAMALLRRGIEPSPLQSRIGSWRWYVPAVLLPAEWLLPPILIALRVGEIEVSWLPVRVIGLAAGLAGTVLLTWSAVVLGRFMMHEAAVREDHALIRNGPYRFIRHPVYAGYLALLLGSGVASLNICLWLLWPVSLIGILIQAASEEQLLGQRFGQEYERYVRRTGRLVPRFWGQAAEPDTAADGGREPGFSEFTGSQRGRRC